jgi:hypothetical protein
MIVFFMLLDCKENVGSTEVNKWIKAVKIVKTLNP